MVIRLKDPTDIVGTRFGLLVVAKFLHEKPYRYGKEKQRLRRDYTYLCQCDCGSSAEVLRTNLQSKHTMSCGCAWKPKGERNWLWTGFSEISGMYWGRLQRGAQNRGIQFKLTIQEAWDVFVQQQRKCALTGLDLHFGKGQTASVDRIDSSAGYELGNIQWVHKDINKMKMDRTTQQFISMCRLVALHHDSKKAS